MFWKKAILSVLLVLPFTFGTPTTVIAAANQSGDAPPAGTTIPTLLRGLYFSDATLREVRAAVEWEPWRAALRDDITSDRKSTRLNSSH